MSAKRGKVLCIGSGVAFVMPPFLGAYAMSKVALEALCHVLRRECPQLGVSLIVSGAIATPIWQQLRDEVTSLTANMSAAQREQYAPRLHGFWERNLKAAPDSKQTPEQFAGAVVRITNARRLRARYVLGQDARFGLWVSRLLPFGALDRVWRKLSSLPRGRDLTLELPPEVACAAANGGLGPSSHEQTW